MSFDMLLGAMLSIAMVQMLAELVQAEREARPYIQAAVMAHGQHAHLAAMCQQSEAAEERGGIFQCQTKLYWIVGASKWQDVCTDLSGPKTAPLRWYMVATDCTILPQPDQHQGELKNLHWRPWRITHWVAKS